MNIIFLDIDGVLNTERYIIVQYEKNGNVRVPLADYNFDPIALNNLKELVEKTNSKIVVSSSWRIRTNDFRLWELGQYLNDQSWDALIRNLESINVAKEIIDVTPWLGKQRGDEIRKWLSDHPDVDKFVILDDDSDMCEFTETNLAKCSWKNGLIDEVKEKALEIINRR